YHIHMTSSSNDVKSSLVRADYESPRGWCAPYYFCREPALSADLTTISDSVVFWTVFGPQSVQLLCNEMTTEIRTADWRATVTCDHGAEVDHPFLTAVSLTGAVSEQLEITSCTFS